MPWIDTKTGQPATNQNEIMQAWQQQQQASNPFNATMQQPGANLQSTNLGNAQKTVSLGASSQPVPSPTAQTPPLATPAQKKNDRAAVQAAYDAAPDLTSADTIASAYKNKTGKSLFAPVDSSALSDATGSLSINEYINQAKQGMQDPIVKRIMNDPKQRALFNLLHNIDPQVAYSTFGIGTTGRLGLDALTKLQGLNDKNVAGTGRLTQTLINYFQNSNAGLGKSWDENLGILDTAQKQINDQLNSWANSEFYDNWQEVPELQGQAKSQQAARAEQMQYANGQIPNQQNGGGRPPLSSFDQ